MRKHCGPCDSCSSSLILTPSQLEDALLDLEEQNRELERIGDAIAYNRVRFAVRRVCSLLIVPEWQLYVLLPEKRVREYSIQQSSEIEPQITELLQLAEKSVKNLERKEAALRQKVQFSHSTLASGLQILTCHQYRSSDRIAKIWGPRPTFYLLWSNRAFECKRRETKENVDQTASRPRKRAGLFTKGVHRISTSNSLHTIYRAID